MTLFAASRKLRRDCEQVFINQLNFRPSSIGKHNSMGHLLPYMQLISKQITHPYICSRLGYLAWQLSRAMLFQWGLANRKCPVRLLSATTSSVWRTLWKCKCKVCDICQTQTNVRRQCLIAVRHVSCKVLCQQITFSYVFTTTTKLSINGVGTWFLHDLVSWVYSLNVSDTSWVH